MYLKYFSLLAIITLSEAKGCPQHSKPHSTRCDMYFKCALLPSKNHVWVPTKCDAGLIYEPSLRMCVLAGDDWECTLGDNSQMLDADENNVYGINNLGFIDGIPAISDTKNQWDQSIMNEDISSQIGKNGEESSNENIIVVNNDNYDDNNIEISDGYEPVPLKGISESSSEISVLRPVMNESVDELESSGDGVSDSSNNKMENKENYIAIPISSDPKASVASHLQRLSQLIQSLRDSQHNQSQTYELSPSDLNNFLANHNIQSQFPDEAIANSNKQTLSFDGKIHAGDLSEILQLQQNLQDLSNLVLSTTTATTALSSTIRTPTTSTTSSSLISSSGNVKKYNDLTRIRIKNTSSLKNSKNDLGYSSSQIVVNRPEGSVLFSIPANNPPSSSSETNKNDPFISEDTLKTMLELSKQMMSNSHHNQDYAPVEKYLQPIFRPIYYNIPIHELPIPVISNINEKSSADNSRKKKPSKNGIRDTSAVQTNNDDMDYFPVNLDDIKGEDRATIIHNHIPITIERSKESGNEKHDSNNSPVKIETDDSFNIIRQTPSLNFNGYGDIKGYHTAPIKIDFQSYPTSNYDQDQSYNSYDFKPAGIYGSNTNMGYNIYSQKPSNYPTQTYNQNMVLPLNSALDQMAHPYYMQQQKQQAPDSQPTYSSGLNNYESNAFGTFQENAHFSPYYQQAQAQYRPSFSANYYTASPHLNEHNVNNFLSINTPSYPTVKPSYTYTNPLDGPFQNQMNSPTTEMTPISDSRKEKDEENLIESDDVNSEEINDNNDESAESSLSDVQQNNQDELTSSLLADNKKKVVNFGGNLMSYETFEKTIAPLLRGNPTINKDIEIITCVSGARQPNKTDCTRYFVCNGKTGVVLPYLCPPFTAFNSQTRFCDAKTYAACNPVHLQTQITIDENKRMQIKAQEALNEANRVRNEALKTQRLAALIQLQTQNMFKVPMVKKESSLLGTQSRPITIYRSTKKPTIVPNLPIIRKISCREPGKVPDALSKYNYFLCYKGADNKLRARKMTCPGALVFCKYSRLCTASDKCSTN